MNKKEGGNFRTLSFKNLFMIIKSGMVKIAVFQDFFFTARMKAGAFSSALKYRSGRSAE